MLLPEANQQRILHVLNSQILPTPLLSLAYLHSSFLVLLFVARLIAVPHIDLKIVGIDTYRL